MWEKIINLKEQSIFKYFKIIGLLFISKQIFIHFVEFPKFNPFIRYKQILNNKDWVIISDGSKNYIYDLCKRFIIDYRQTKFILFFEENYKDPELIANKIQNITVGISVVIYNVNNNLNNCNKYFIDKNVSIIVLNKDYLKVSPFHKLNSEEIEKLIKENFIFENLLLNYFKNKNKNNPIFLICLGNSICKYKLPFTQLYSGCKLSLKSKIKRLDKNLFKILFIDDFNEDSKLKGVNSFFENMNGLGILSISNKLYFIFTSWSIHYRNYLLYKLNSTIKNK